MPTGNRPTSGTSPVLVAWHHVSNIVTSAARTLRDALSAVIKRCSVAQGADNDRQPAR